MGICNRSRRGFAVLALFICLFIVLRSYMVCSPYLCKPLASGEPPLSSNALKTSAACLDVESSIQDTFPSGSVALVVASIENEDTSWIHDNFPDWMVHIYTLNGPHANASIPKNKGRESMAYLTYIIENYHDLPDYIIFSHGSRWQWHNEDPMYDGVPVLQRLQLQGIARQGYANLRCTWALGCSGAVHPGSPLTKVEAFLEPHNYRANMEASFSNAYLELFGTPAPSELRIPCCAQFAVTRDQIRKRGLCDYEWFRTWLLKTSLPDGVSGRIMEYSWHIIMSMPPVHCPPAEHCFCETFGLCDLECPDEGNCEGRYWLPPTLSIPEQWPEVGPGTNGLPDWGWSEARN